MSELLPILKEPKPLKEHVSYSEVSVWMDCQWRHKIKYIDGILLDGPSEHTEFGHLIHSALEQYMKTKTFPNIDELKLKLSESFKELKKEDLNPVQWADTIEPILTETALFLDTEFPGWEFVAAEQELNESIVDQKKRFKGYIDGIIKVRKPARKNAKNQEPGEEEYWIIDYKTTSFGWTLEKKIDPKKTMQLAFYKHFWSTKLNIPITKIKCGFLLLKRTAKNGNYRRAG